MTIRKFLYLSLLLASLAPSFSKADAKFNYSSEAYKLELHEWPNRQVIVFNGEIMPTDSEKPLKKMLSLLVPGKDIVLAMGVSGGGEAKAFMKFGRSLRDACPVGDCVITTHVQAACGSACVWLYMFGDVRVSSPSAVFVFHRKEVSGLGIHVPIQSKKEWKKLFISFGADAKWIEANGDGLLANQKDGVFANPEQMVRAGIVHQIDSGFAVRNVAIWPSEFYGEYGPGARGEWLTENLPN